MTTAPLQALRAHLPAIGVDGVVVPFFDAHQGEYIAGHDARLRLLTGFTGSAGIALVLADRAVIFVDGRYQVQVRKEIDLAAFEISHFYDFPIDKWIATHVAKGTRIGVNPMLVPTELFERLQAAMATAGGELVPLDADPIDAIWPDQPEPPTGRISAFPVKFSGETSASKRQRIAGKLAELSADFLVETQPDNIAWLLNIRGSDVPATPIAHSFMLLDRDGAVEWFVDERKLPNDREEFELDGVTTSTPADLLGRIEQLSAGKAALVDPRFASVATALAVKAGGGSVVSAVSPITVAKANKNATELQGFRDAHVEDGVALTEFLYWMQANVAPREAAGNPITELEAEAQLLAFRRPGNEFTEASFRTIAASASNAAMCHYAATTESNTVITTADVFLLDSGGQYRTGTTDVTRTMAFAPVSDAVRRTYTAVLQGFISLMTAQFPAGTTGHHLDALARRPLWDLGLDYDHGTGHGVGHFLSVHEHPHRFGKAVNAFPLEAGVIMTIEPGYYLEGEYGLRVENQVETVAGAPGFLRFETLTLAPIALDMADVSALTKAEKSFINAYHARVLKALSGRLSPAAQAWAEQQTRPI